MTDELRAAARDFYNTVAIMAVVCDLSSLVIGWNPVVAAGARLRLALLNQDGTAVVADSLKPIAAAALGANEVHPEAVDGSLDSAEPGERLAAADALEHSRGVLLGDDSRATVLGVIDSAYTLLSSRVWDPLLAVDMDDAEEFRKAWAKIAEALAEPVVPEGYVLVDEKIFCSMREFVTGFHGLSRNNAENLAAEILEHLNAARPEVKP